MKYSKKQINDIKTIMSVREEWIPVLKYFRPESRFLNPWKKQLAEVFSVVKPKKDSKILDLACGQGGVSVYLAKKYGAKVNGCDINPDFIKIAKDYAKKSRVSGLCRFYVSDARDFVKRKELFDVVVWCAAPHVWGPAEKTLKKLKAITAKGGFIVIADAYLHKETAEKGYYKNYNYFNDFKKAVRLSGLKMVFMTDHKNDLWDYDYRYTVKNVKQGIKNAKSTEDKELIKQFLNSINADCAALESDMGVLIAALKRMEK